MKRSYSIGRRSHNTAERKINMAYVGVRYDHPFTLQIVTKNKAEIIRTVEKNALFIASPSMVLYIDNPISFRLFFTHLMRSSTPLFQSVVGWLPYLKNTASEYLIVILLCYVFLIHLQLTITKRSTVSSIQRFTKIENHTYPTLFWQRRVDLNSVICAGSSVFYITSALVYLLPNDLLFLQLLEY